MSYWFLEIRNLRNIIMASYANRVEVALHIYMRQDKNYTREACLQSSLMPKTANIGIRVVGS